MYFLDDRQKSAADYGVWTCSDILIVDMNDIKQLKAEIDTALQTVGFDKKTSDLANLTAQSQAEDFWQDSDAAQKHMQKQAKLQATLEPWASLKKQIDDLAELSAMNDDSLAEDLQSGLEKVRTEYEALKKQLQFSGIYDDHDVLLSIHAGAGGTDAQDWAQMLCRMYTRWADSGSRETAHRGGEASGTHSPSIPGDDSLRSSASSGAAPSNETQKYTVKVIEESPGQEAGLKSVTLEISGPFAYGKLQGEHGVHRLVRLSPFNADAKRQTSFAKVEIMPKIDSPDEVPLDDAELKVDVYRAGGHGGQSVNTTDSAVRITHLPTGVVVAIQNERSQLQNKETALTILRSRLAQLQAEQHLENLAEIKGPNQSAEWGSQIRSYVLHPYTMVKDLRTKHETNNAAGVLDGDLNSFIDAYLEANLS